MLAKKLLMGGVGNGVAITDPNHPNLDGMWTMNNISGTTLLDESPNGRDFTLINSPTTVTGVIGDGLLFDGVDQSAEQGAPPLNSEGALAFWTLPNLSPQARILHITPEGVGDNIWGVIVQPSGKVFIGKNPETPSDFDGVESVTPVTAVTNGYGFVVVQGDESTIEIYINGALSTLNFSPFGSGGSVESFSNWFADNTGVDFMSIGVTKSNTTNFGKTQVNQMRLFNRKLTQDEITTLTNET